jgi:plastocyanin
MRRPLIAVLVVMSIVAAGCASSTPPAWTYAPPTPEPTPGPSASAGASGGPSASGPAASAVASAVASAEAGGGASGAPAGSGAAGAPVVVEALNLEFKTPEVNSPASVPFQIEFRNGDAGTPHNVDIKDASGNEVFKGDIVTGVIVATYNVPALAPGTYPFVCDVHPNMTGTLKVGG